MGQGKYCTRLCINAFVHQRVVQCDAVEVYRLPPVHGEAVRCEKSFRTAADVGMQGAEARLCCLLFDMPHQGGAYAAPGVSGVDEEVVGECVRLRVGIAGHRVPAHRDERPQALDAPAQAARCLWSKSAAVRPSIARMNICRSPRSSPLAKARMVICGRAFPECGGTGSRVRICNVLFRGGRR